MQNLINTNNLSNIYASSHNKRREDIAAEPSLLEKEPHSNIKSQQIKEDAINKNEETKKEEEKKEQIKKESTETVDHYQKFMARIAENEEKKASLSEQTKNQEKLEKQLEKSISPVNQHSFDFKV